MKNLRNLLIVIMLSIPFIACEDNMDDLGVATNTSIYMRTDDVVLRVIDDSNYPSYFIGIIVDSPNQAVQCDTVGARYANYVVCENCVDNCN